MNDINEILRELLDRYPNPTEQDQIWHQMLSQDRTLESDYKEWCDAQGYQTASGYRDFLNELAAQRDSFWDTADDYGNNL